MNIKSLLYTISILVMGVGCTDDDGMMDDPVDPGPKYSQYGTPFDGIPAAEDIIMYEVNLRAFSETGGLQGVIDRLDEIEALGINVIWLMPIHPIGDVNSVNSPYSVRDYKAVSPEYGGLDNLRRLTDQAHQRDMAVIMDWVANHTAWDHPWIQNRNWYTQDGNGNIVHPPGTNWQDVADLDYSNRTMQDSMIDAMKYWILEANVDGYRCDYANGVPFSFWSRALDTLEAIPGRQYVLLAEGDRNDHYQAGFQLTYAWEFYGKMKDVFAGQFAAGLFSVHDDEYRSIPPGRHKLRFTTNHDETAWDATPIELFGGKDGALAASVLAVFMGGAPLIYTGQEVGTTENTPFFSNDPIDWGANPDMLETYREIMAAYGSIQAARTGNMTKYPTANVVCFTRTTGADQLAVIVNVRDSEIQYSVPVDLRGTSWTNAISGETVELGASLELGAFEYLIVKSEE